MTNKNEKAKEVLEELEAYLNSAKYAIFSNSQIVVDRVKMEEFIQQLRQYMD
ncbi:MAG: hypothetical protein MR871_00405 [Lachnospiraceae bacterium]|nr:hypothetical protein [Lachnospiraceae bacterium]MDD7076883.1 hypothetical protein [Lachnospiraceae bacterium]MDY3728849.1 hypothetical protein [Candidatus Choladocola sp.]